MQIPEILFWLLWFSGALWGFVGFWIYFYKFKIFKDRLEVSNFEGLYKSVIDLNDIVSIEKIQRIAKYESWEECVIKTVDKRKFKIYNSCDDNYSQIIKALPKKNSNQKFQKENEQYSKRGSVIIVIIGILGIWFYLNTQIDNKEIRDIELTLNKKPLITDGTKSRKNLILTINEYPDFDFNIYGVGYEKVITFQRLLENTEGGDKITLTIGRDDYEQKLLKKTHLTFWNKYFNFKHISIYGIKNKKLIFLSSDDYIEEQKDSDKWFYLIIITLISIAIYEIMKSKKTKNT